MPIVDKLKEALKPGRKDSADDGELGKLLAASAKKVLLQKIEFEPASRSFSYQLESLKSKYVLLNPRAEGPGRHRGGEEPQARRPGTGAQPAGGKGLAVWSPSGRAKQRVSWGKTRLRSSVSFFWCPWTSVVGVMIRGWSERELHP